MCVAWKLYGTVFVNAARATGAQRLPWHECGAW